MNHRQRSDDDWRGFLTPEAFQVLREGRTERGGSGRLLYHFQDGFYRCAGCGTHLFSGDSKYDSGTGWPSFWSCLDEGVCFRDDPLHGMRRLEAVCSGCGGHLGHLFDDHESPTNQRFCINSAALDFQADESLGL